MVVVKNMALYAMTNIFVIILTKDEKLHIGRCLERIAALSPRLYEWADVFVACGLCEPWGMRVSDAIHAGLPVVVSNGMGASWLVEQFGCGCVYEKGKARQLADCLERFARDVDFRTRLVSGVESARTAWSPASRAKVFLDCVKEGV